MVVGDAVIIARHADDGLVAELIGERANAARRRLGGEGARRQQERQKQRESNSAAHLDFDCRLLKNVMFCFHIKVTSKN